MIYQVLVTGDRNWKDRAVIREVLKAIRINGRTICLIHGACRGADTIAAEEARKLGFMVIPVPADFSGADGRSAGPKRNQRMVELGPSLCLAFHDDLKQSRGTRDCVLRALKAGITTLRFKQGMQPCLSDLPR